MSISAWVGNKDFELGAPSFFKAFFSTVFVHLEGRSWGSRFPAVMNGLYSGRMAPAVCGAALEELHWIRKELQRFPPSAVVWDFENPSARPPWGDRISPEITSLGDYFITSAGDDLLETLESALRQARDTGKPLVIM